MNILFSNAINQNSYAGRFNAEEWRVFLQRRTGREPETGDAERVLCLKETIR